MSASAAAQATHAEPALPQLAVDRGVQLAPAQHPLGQLAALQAPPLHAYGVQSVPPTASPQVPEPSQVCSLATVPRQSGDPHVVPDG